MHLATASASIRLYAAAPIVAVTGHHRQWRHKQCTACSQQTSTSSLASAHARTEYERPNAPPPATQGYYQEAGRAGRDGLASEVSVFWSPADIGPLRKIIMGACGARP